VHRCGWSLTYERRGCMDRALPSVLESQFDSSRDILKNRKRGGFTMASSVTARNKLEIRRMFAAPREKVFEAWTQRKN